MLQEIKQSKKIMKTTILALAAVASIFFTSCTKDDATTIIPTGPATGEITGSIKTSKTFAYGNYTLKGIVKIEAGVVVTFEAGSVITVDKTTGDNAFVVLNGGKLITNGTADKPVIFTEKSKIPGSWGGIIMYGDAPAKVAGGKESSTSEDGNKISYGGTNPTHKGGSLNYTRVEYAGAKLADGDKENNGFTFYSVGSGTTLDHLVSYKGADDGYEFFGGTVSMTNSISYGNYDDAFDWQDGWQGALNSNWYAYQTEKGNYGMEIEASSNDNAYFPIVKNITLKRDVNCVPEVGDNQVDAIQFKKEGNGEYSNIIIDGYGNFNSGKTIYYGTAIRIQDDATNLHQVATSKIKLTNTKISNTTALFNGATDAMKIAFPTGSFTQLETATGASLTKGAWCTVDGISLLK